MSGQLPLAMAARRPPGFEHFVVGDNAAALHNLRHGTDSVYLHGPAGCGKTHLLRARARSEAGALYVPAAAIDTTESLVGAESARWLGVDDLEALSGRPEAATALLRVLDGRRARSLPLAVAARCEAGELPPLILRDLRTRLMQCSTFRLKPLDDEALRAWLAQRAHQRGLQISDTAVAWLLRHQRRDPGHLESVLEQLDIAALAAKRGRITVPFVRMVLGEG
jgi:DnaA regulatory inactivator Hda